jgi:hypothetical protein
MITVKLLVCDLWGNLSEVPANVMVDDEFALTLTDLCEALVMDNITVIRIELPVAEVLSGQRFLIPSDVGIVSLGRRVPIT